MSYTLRGESKNEPDANLRPARLRRLRDLIRDGHGLSMVPGGTGWVLKDTEGEIWAAGETTADYMDLCTAILYGRSKLEEVYEPFA